MLENPSHREASSTRYKSLGVSLLNMEPVTAGLMLPPATMQSSGNGLGLGEHPLDRQYPDEPRAVSNLLKRSESAARTRET
jgi:hypothetical protein